MHGAGRGWRVYVLLGAVAMVASGFLRWWHAGGGEVGGIAIPFEEGIGLQGPGLVIYVAAIASLVFLNLGYMRGEWGFPLDAPAAYLLLGLTAATALLYRGWELWTVQFVPVPSSSPGFAAAAVGIGLVLYGSGTGLAARSTV
jgi:hypothetical protein